MAWSSKCIDKRCYDYSAIADSCDLLFVMSYDEQSQIWGDCIAMANAPYNQTLTGEGLIPQDTRCSRQGCLQAQTYADIASCLKSHVFLSAYEQYLEMKIDPKKLVMGVPWYGYDYPCLAFSQVKYMPDFCYASFSQFIL